MDIFVWMVAPAFVGFVLGWFVGNRDHAAKCDNCLTMVCDGAGAMVQIFLSDVQQEISAARRKHPGNAHLLVALMEEVGELAKAHLEHEPASRVWAEAKQVACVAGRIALETDADFALIESSCRKGPLPNVDDEDDSFPDPPSRARVAGGLQ